MPKKRDENKRALQLRGKNWYASFYDADGKLQRISTGLSNYDAAVAFYDKHITPQKRAIREGKVSAKLRLIRYSDVTSVAKEWRNYLASIKDNKKAWVSDLYNNIISRSKRKGMPCDLTYEDVYNLAIASNGRCQITDIPFSPHKPAGCKSSPYGPSIDRIDSRQGYSKTNCRLVCYAVNMALNQWGESILEKISMAFLYKRMRSEFEETLFFEKNYSVQEEPNIVISPSEKKTPL